MHVGIDWAVGEPLGVSAPRDASGKFTSAGPKIPKADVAAILGLDFS